MISDIELEQEGFVYSSDTAEWEKDNIKISVNEGHVTFVRERDNYHGLNVLIRSIEGLTVFMGFIP